MKQSLNELTRRIVDNDLGIKVYLKSYDAPAFLLKTIDRYEAQYHPEVDSIVMNEAWHRSEVDFFSTLIHELSHATGHASRLNRAGISQRFGMAWLDFHVEELIAQRSCQLVMQSLGLNACPIEYKCSTNYMAKQLFQIETLSPSYEINADDIETQANDSAQFILKKVLKF
jgi:hypothetical protein